MKRMVVIADLHTGHRAGLTPPEWQYSLESRSDTNAKYAEMQRYVWKWYEKTLKSLQPIDVLIVNGDAVDGKGLKSGGTELITGDINQQIAMAQECIEVAKAKDIVMTYGTPYHTGSENDWETPLAKEMGATIVSHKELNIEDVIFDVRHFTSRSVIPHGRNTGPNREALWNLLWAEKKGLEKADVLIRSHVHYFVYSGDPDTLIVVTPALQGPGSKYGTRVCSGIVDMGMVVFNVEKGKYTWEPKLLNMKPLVDRPIRL